MDRNPYAPPEADTAPLSDRQELALPDAPAPWQHWIALLLIAGRQAIWILLLAAGLPGRRTRVHGIELLTPVIWPALAIGALSLVGAWRRSALARHWNLISPIFAAALIALGGLMVFRDRSDSPLALTALAIVVLGSQIAVPYLLSTRAARLYFGLQCPSCGKVSGGPADVLYRWKRCSCGARWRHVRR